MAKLICCYCKKVLDENYPTELDSHGVCKEDLKRVLADIKKNNDKLIKGAKK